MYRFELDSPHTVETIVERLRAMVAERPSFKDLKEVLFLRRELAFTEFWGPVEVDSFRLEPALGYRNDFAPGIDGRIVATPAGPRVIVRMSMQPATTMFMAVWLAAFAFASAATVFQGRSTDAWMPAAFVVVGLLLSGGGFYFEATKSRRVLEERLGQNS